MKLIYSKLQIIKAAKFIWKKNTAVNSGEFITSVYDLIDRIEADLLRYADEVKRHIKDDKDWRILSTMGYTILIILEGKDVLVAEVLVDPAVSKDTDSTEVKI